MKKHNEIVLSEQEIGKAYTEALRFLSLSRRIISDQTRQYMADAVREFYQLLEARIDSKRTPQGRINSHSRKAQTRAGLT
jgi:hypothetical protein